MTEAPAAAEGSAQAAAHQTFSRRLLDRLSGRLLRRLSWNVIDQIVSSLTNAALAVVVAKSVSAEQFGAFSIAFTAYSVLVQTARGLTGQPLWIRFSGADVASYRAAARASVGGTLLFSAATGAGCAAIGLVVRGQVGIALVAIGAGLPALLWQDAWRMVFFGQPRPAAAALNDVVWAIAQVAIVGALVLGAKGTAATLLLGWSASAGLAALVGIRQAGWLPSLNDAWAFVRHHWDITKYLVGELVIVQGGLQGALLLVGAIGAVADVGSFRAAVVILGPVSILSTGMSAFAVPELARRPGLSRHQRVRLCTALSLGMMVFALTWALIVLALPRAAGQAALGDTWVGARSILVPSLIQQLGLLAGLGPGIMCYALGRTRETFRTHCVLSALTVIGGVVGVRIDGAFGAATGFAFAAWIVVPLWWQQMLVLSQLPPSGEPAPAT